MTAAVAAPPVFVEPADAHVRLTLPYNEPPQALKANERPHWSRRNKDTRQVRTDVMRLAQAAGLHRLPPIAHITAVLVWAPGNRIRRDPINLAPFVKALCDGLARGNRKDLIGLDLVPDDTQEWMDQRTAVLVPPPAKGMWLDLSIRFAEEAS